MEVVKIQGAGRAGTGKRATKSDRAKGVIPCVLYGGNENIHFTTSWNEVRHIIYTGDFKTAEITVDGSTHKAVLKDVQFHPASEQILHIDFLKIISGHPLKLTVPLRLVGQAPGVKSGGKLIQSVRKVKIKCMPESMVDQVSLDVSHLDLGQTVRVKDINSTEGVEIMMAPNIPVALIEIPRALRSAQAAEAKGK
jgi:large subunit ribosomal protein L25